MAKRRKTQNTARRGFIGYRSYMFKTKDPAIDGLRTIVQDEKGKINAAVLRDLEAESGVRTATMRGWFFGDTITARNSGLEAVGRGFGYHRPWQRMKRKANGSNGHGK